MYIDTATSEQELSNNDPTGILVFRPVNNRIYLIDFIKGMWGANTLTGTIKNVARKYFEDSRSKVVIENKSNGPTIKQILVDNTKLSVILETPKGKKLERVEIELPTLETGRVLIPETGSWVQPFIQQCTGFPKLKHDEEVDCLTGAVRVSFPRQEKKQSRKAKAV